MEKSKKEQEGPEAVAQSKSGCAGCQADQADSPQEEILRFGTKQAFEEGSRANVDDLVSWAAPDAHILQLQQTILDIFACLLDQGVQPHPFGSDHSDARTYDECVALMLAAGVPAATKRGEPSRPPGSIPFPSTGEGAPSSSILPGAVQKMATRATGSEENVGPSPTLGIRNPISPLPVDPCVDPSTSDFAGSGNYAFQYGCFCDVLADLARTGVGVVSHINKPDLPWFHLAEMRWGYIEPSEEEGVEGTPDTIPAPAELYAQLTEEEFWTFRAFTLYVIACHLHGMQVMPVLFDYGGGSRFNKSDHEFDWCGCKVDKANMRAGMPAHQTGFSVLSEDGWDDWYWQHGEADAVATPGVYQKWALNVWNPDSESDYMRQCALRKALGVAAYATAVGEYLAALDRAFSSCEHLGGSVTDVIPRVDLANEMDSYYYNVDPPDGDEEGTFFEMGRFAALLACPIADQGLGIRFRMFDLFGFNKEEHVDPKLTWLKDCISAGMIAETDRWARLYGYYQTEDPDDLAAVLLDMAESMLAGEVSYDDVIWIQAMDEADFVWPRSYGKSAKVLVHHVGFHFFRSVTMSYPDISTDAEYYQDEQAIGDAARRMVALVVSPLREMRYDIAWSIGAMCFPALAPDPMEGDKYFTDENPDYPDGNPEYLTTNPEYQAGILARRMLYAKALPDGPDIVTWYTFMADLACGEFREERTTWSRYTATGLRNEIYGAVPGGQQTARINDVRTAADFYYGCDAFRRPSWFTLRRVAWLLQRAERAELLYQDEHRYVLRLTASHSFEEELQLLDVSGAEDAPWREASESWAPSSQRERPNAGGAASVAYKYAYVAWFDQQPGRGKSLEDSFSFWLADASEDGYQLLPLVPEVTYDMSCGDTDANGYPDCETVSWGDGFTDATVQEHDKLGDFAVLQVTVPRASPANPGPVCVLCNADRFSSAHFPRESPFRNQLAELLQTILAGPDAPDPDRFRLVTELFQDIQSTW